MKIYLATDHKGFFIKNRLKDYLISNNFEVIDFGANIYNNEDDYPDFIHEAAKALSVDNEAINYNDFLDQKVFAFVFGKSGSGESMVMNRYKNVRCLHLYDYNENIIKLSRRHNNANSISFGSEFLDFESIKKSIELFLNTNFEGDRHINRINKIEDKL